MAIKDQPPLDYVDRSVYNEEAGDRLALSEVMEGATYIARLIVNPLCEKDFGADYWVSIDAIKKPRTRLWLPKLSKDTVKVSLLYLPGDYEPRPEAPADTYSIAEDGMLFLRSERMLTIIDTHQGYLLDDDDEVSDELQDIVRKGLSTPVKPHEPCFV